MIDPKELNLRNIRKYKGRYAVRIMRGAKTLKEASKIKKFIEKYINCVSIYQNIKQNSFTVQTYKEYKSLEDAVKARDFIENELKKFKGES